MLKKSLAICLMAFIFSLTLASALEIEMNSEFKQGETLFAKVSANFIDPPAQDKIFFYRDHVRVSIIPKMELINEEYYISAPLPEKNANYSMVIEDVKYRRGTQVVEEDLVSEFLITNETARFSIDPAFIYAKEDFEISIVNLDESKITVSIEIDADAPISSGDEVSDTPGFFALLFGGTEKTSPSYSPTDASTVEIKSGDTEKLKFLVGDVKGEAMKNIVLSSGDTVYNIPVYIFLNKSISDNEERKVRFETPGLSNADFTTGKEYTRIFYLKNEGENSVGNISLTVSSPLNEEINLSVTEIEELEANSSIKIEMTIRPQYTEKTIEGQITARINNTNILPETFFYTPIKLNFIPEFTYPNGTVPSGDISCVELGGSVCKDTEECSGDELVAKESGCCEGDCVAKEGSSSTGKIIGWLIVIGIVGFLIWFFLKKYRGAKDDKKINLLDIIKKKSKKSE